MAVWQHIIIFLFVYRRKRNWMELAGYPISALATIKKYLNSRNTQVPVLMSYGTRALVFFTRRPLLVLEQLYSSTVSWVIVLKYWYSSSGTRVLIPTYSSNCTQVLILEQLCTINGIRVIVLEKLYSSYVTRVIVYSSTITRSIVLEYFQVLVHTHI